MGLVWNRYGEVIGTTSGASYTDNSNAATNTHGGGAQASKPWTGGGSSTPASSSNSSNSSRSSGSSTSSSTSSSGGSSSGSSGGSSSSSSSQSEAAWWKANFGYVPSWVSGGSSNSGSSNSNISTPPPVVTPPASGSGSSSSGSSGSSSPLSASYSDSVLSQIRAGNTALGWSEIAKAGQDYNAYANDATRQAAAHDWANKVRDAMGISGQYDSTTGAYTGGGTDPNPYKSGSSNTGSGNNSNTPVLGNQTNTPAPLVPNSPQFQQGSYGFDSNANKIPVNLGNGQVINGVMKDGYTYVPIKQMANVMGGQLGNYDPNNLTIQVNGKTVPVHIDSNGVGYAPVRNMADAFGASVGWNSKYDGSVSDVFLAQPTVNQQQPVIDQQKLLEEQQLAERQKMIEELLKQFQQPIPMPQMPEMPQLPQRQPSYEDFLERAREMINPAYAKARETLSRVNEQQRQLMIQRLAAKGQPFGGLREEMEMQLAQDFMNQLSDQDMQQLSEALKIAQSLSEQDEQQARWLADQAWQRWQAQANIAQQQYQYAVNDRNTRLTGLMNLAKYLQGEEQARREAALEQAKFDWQQKKDLLPYTTPDANMVFRMGNISADKAADLELERWKWENPSANAYLGYQGDLARANAYSSNQRQYTPPQWIVQQDYDAVANQFADALQSYASYEDMIGGIQSARPYLDPMTAEALMRLGRSMEPLYYSTNPAGQRVGKSGPKFKPAEESPTGGYDPLRVKWNTSPYAGSQYGGTIDGAMPGAHEVNQFLNKPQQPQIAAPQSFWQRLMGALSGSRSIEDY